MPKPTMGMMLQGSLRAPVTRLITPLCRGLIRIGISANAMSLIGAGATIAAALIFFPSGHFFAGTIWVLVFVLFDLLDGTIARLSNKGSNAFGALLDSTLDRLSDSAVIGGILWYEISNHDRLAPVVLISLVAGFMVSYIKARAESLNIKCDGGLAERTERLIIVLLTTALVGYGVDWAMAVGIWLLAVASVFTAFQRIFIVSKSLKMASN
jgi:CDP-diacylglycerol---glycerol-3-phosphate 3-phosphatidyltransferase